MIRKNFKAIIVVIITVIMFVLYFKYVNSTISTFALSTANKTIIIDPGHGGFDPGKVGNVGSHEKDINLQISLKLQSYLEQSGAHVIMTRTKDKDLDGDDTKKSKKQDMLNRSEIINNNEGDILISIHQNAFPDSTVKGAQAFYYNDSKEGDKLAKSIQDSIKKYADKENKRMHKSNSDYYVLRTSQIPAVIVECGFLTNTQEEERLNTDEYQEEMAWAMYIGVIEYFQD